MVNTDDTKPLPEPMLRLCGIHLWAIWQEILKIPILDKSLKITNFRLQLHLTEANELKGFKHDTIKITGFRIPREGQKLMQLVPKSNVPWV